MSKDYRIVKRYTRERDEKVSSYYIIQYSAFSFWKTIFFLSKHYVWKDYTILELISGTTHTVTYTCTFNSIREAKKRIENLKTPVYSDEIILK